MTIQRGWIFAALAISLGAAGWTAFASRDARRSQRAEEEAYARRLGDALIRQGIALYQKGEYSAAINAWERYIKSAPPNADTLSIREMIGEAQNAATPKPKSAPRAKKSSARRSLLRYVKRRTLVPPLISTVQHSSAELRLPGRGPREVGA